MKKEQPVSGKEYSLSFILSYLELRDSPHLGFLFEPPAKRDTDEWRESDEFAHGPRRQCVQTAHISDAQLLTLPGWADSKWRYLLETSEWIPVFQYAGPGPITDLVDMEPDNSPYAHPMDPREWWVTPKGAPREQFYGPDGKPREVYGIKD